MWGCQIRICNWRSLDPIVSNGFVPSEHCKQLTAEASDGLGRYLDIAARCWRLKPRTNPPSRFSCGSRSSSEFAIPENNAEAGKKPDRAAKCDALALLQFVYSLLPFCREGTTREAGIIGSSHEIDRDFARAGFRRMVEATVQIHPLS